MIHSLFVEDAIHISRTPVQAPDKATGVALKKPAVSTSPPRTQSKPKSIPQHDKPIKPSGEYIVMACYRFWTSCMRDQWSRISH